MKRLLPMLLLSLLWGCPDTRARYDAYLDRTADMRVAADDSGVGMAERVDFSGAYLLSLSTVVAPSTPIRFQTQVDVAADLSSLDMRLQALTVPSDPEPGTPVGDPILVADIPYGEDGIFEADLGEVQVPGAANPITGSDIVAEVQIRGVATLLDAGEHIFCGEAGGMVTVPIAIDLAGSTFGAVETDDPANTEPLLRCPDAVDGSGLTDAGG